MVWAFTIFLLILMPGQQMPDFGDLFSFDKLAHLGVFCILCFLMIIGFSKQHSFPSLKDNAEKYSILISGSYATVLELGQALVPDRYANYYDLAFNLIGVAVGYALFILIYKFSFD